MLMATTKDNFKQCLQTLSSLAGEWDQLNLDPEDPGYLEEERHCANMHRLSRRLIKYEAEILDLIVELDRKNIE